MKKLIVLFCIILSITAGSCSYNRHHNDINLTYQDAVNSYSMDARFNNKQMRKVERYLDNRLGRDNNFSFVSTNMNARFTFDDASNIYIKKSPGHIIIKLKKYENSRAAYYKIKTVCEGMKDVLTGQN